VVGLAPLADPLAVIEDVLGPARRLRTLSPCGFQAVRRDSQRPCSITTVRFQLSATTVATTYRENTPMPFLV
jgi:hypothetical protein